MQSESARMTTAEQARFRINHPNSKPRSVKVVALDARSEAVVKRLALGQWQNASFLIAKHFDGAPRSGEGWNMRKVMTTALIIGSESKSDEELSKSLASLRPYASMLVIAGNDDYIEAMLVALRA